MFEAKPGRMLDREVLGRLEMGPKIVPDEHRQYRAKVVLGLRIGGKMLIDNLCNFQAFKQRRDHGKRSDIPPFDVRARLISIPRRCIHLYNMANLGAWRNPTFGKISSSGKQVELAALVDDQVLGFDLLDADDPV